MLHFYGLVFLIITSFNNVSTTVSKRVSTFGHSIKNGQLPANTEMTTFYHACSFPPCLITLIHIPSIYPPNNETWNWQQGALRVYVDGEAAPSLQLILADLAALGQFGSKGREEPLDGSPYGTSLFGKTAKTGGVYSTVRIPFELNIRTTIQAAPGTEGTSVYWFIIRGLEATYVRVGDLILPQSARLKIQKTSNVSLKSLEFVTMVDVPKGAGSLLLTQLDATSAGNGFLYLEACLRAFIDGRDEPLFLSSGMEDYFLSASYFDEGMFKTPESGLTYKNGSESAVSAYKTHIRDPVVWNNGIQLVWRNSDTAQGCGSVNDCPNKFCQSKYDQDVEHSDMKMDDIEHVQAANGSVVYSSNVWFYSWQENFEEVDNKPMSNDGLYLKYDALLIKLEELATRVQLLEEINTDLKKLANSIDDQVDHLASKVSGNEIPTISMDDEEPRVDLY